MVRATWSQVDHHVTAPLVALALFAQWVRFALVLQGRSEKQMRRETINMSLKFIEAASCCVRVICFDKWLERQSRSQTARFWHHKAWWLGHGGQGQAFKPSNTPLQDFKTVLASIPYLPSCSSFHCPLCCAIASGHGDYKICLRTAWFAWLWELKLRIFGSHGSTWLKWKCKVIGVIWVEEMWKHTHCILLQYAAAAIHTFFSGLALDLRHLAGYLAQAAVRRGAQPVDAPQCQTPSLAAAQLQMNGQSASMCKLTIQQNQDVQHVQHVPGRNAGRWDPGGVLFDTNCLHPRNWKNW